MVWLDSLDIMNQKYVQDLANLGTPKIEISLLVKTVNKRLVPGIIKNLNSQKTIQLENRQRTSTETSPERIYGWLMST